MKTTDPFGRAVRDFHRGVQTEPLIQRDGADTLVHPIERFYFGDFTPDDADGRWLASWLDGPLLDIGAGAGRHARYFQEQFETVAIEVSDHLVETMRDRGIVDARVADMFALPETFEANRFRSALANGTQVGLAGSVTGLTEFLSDLARVTTPGATVVLDNYDPEFGNARELLGFRDDPSPGLAHRVMHFEYEGDVGATLLFRLFGPDRLAAAATETGWTVEAIRRDPTTESCYYRAALAKP